MIWDFSKCNTITYSKLKHSSHYEEACCVRRRPYVFIPLNCDGNKRKERRLRNIYLAAGVFTNYLSLFLCYCPNDLNWAKEFLLFSVVIILVVHSFCPPRPWMGWSSRISWSGVSVSMSQGKKKRERKELWYRGMDMESQRTPRVKPSVKAFTTFLTRQAETTGS